MKLIRKGKAKDIYEKDDKTLIFHFTNRVSAFDVIMEDLIPYKGKVLCDFAVFWFSWLKAENHFIERIDVDKILVKKLNMIPIECIVRGYLYGSMYSRLISNRLDLNELSIHSTSINPVLASKLPFLVFDPTTKSEEHDSPIVKDQILIKKIINEADYQKLKSESLDLYNQMSKIMIESNFILADTKFEFGKDPSTNSILLADSIGPDECRIWDSNQYIIGKRQESFDKQILRDWLEEVGFAKLVIEFSKDGKKPHPPKLPEDLINKISYRYIEAYERTTKKVFNKNSF